MLACLLLPFIAGADWRAAFRETFVRERGSSSSGGGGGGGSAAAPHSGSRPRRRRTQRMDTRNGGLLCSAPLCCGAGRAVMYF